MPAAPLAAYALADTSFPEPLPLADAVPCAFLLSPICLPVGVTGRHMYG
jgi:hypothetical protein